MLPKPTPYNTQRLDVVYEQAMQYGLLDETKQAQFKLRADEMKYKMFDDFNYTNTPFVTSLSPKTRNFLYKEAVLRKDRFRSAHDVYVKTMFDCKNNSQSR